jgi:hypothetical protein
MASGYLGHARTRRERLRNKPGLLVHRPAPTPFQPKNICPHPRSTLRRDLRSYADHLIPIRKAACAGRIHTSVGVGTCIADVRLNCPPEVTLHRLRNVGIAGDCGPGSCFTPLRARPAVPA